MSRYFRARIKSNLPLNRNHRLLSLVNMERMKDPLPGQFYMLEVSKGNDPLLKRAFSLFRRTSEGFDILYRIQGKGTALLSEMKEKTELDVLGPLGSSYPAPVAGETPVIVAGGIGIASVYSLIEQVRGSAYLLYGAREKDDLFMLDELKAMAREFFISTDDGSHSVRGSVIDMLKGFLSERTSSEQNIVIYACGPRPVLKEVASMADAKGIRAHVSLEEHMACGIGACLGCVVKVKGQEQAGEGSSLYKRVCKEGPVFDAGEIEW
ncbi:MAG: dihydroorotate dehydrogenase electron transfer subunit [Nitrospirae bacterium]|nr:dihydroorotate dehydrogenase electron transfer subunit [Nitrospirota bacterium]